MQRFMALAVVFTISLSGCLSQNLSNPTPEENIAMETTPCNGMIVLCHRTYDNVTFPETHNAHATHQDGIYYPASNHQTGLTAQWQAGMRAFMIDTH